LCRDEETGSGMAVREIPCNSHVQNLSSIDQVNIRTFPFKITHLQLLTLFMIIDMAVVIRVRPMEVSLGRGRRDACFGRWE
jgi:hypothetical protein